MKSCRHRIAACLAVIWIAGTLCGCAGKQSDNIVFDANRQEGEPLVGLTFFGFKYEALNVDAIEHALHGFMDQYPDVTISYEGIKSPEYFDVLEKRLSTGNGDDIVMVDHEQVLKLKDQGMLADLSDLSTLDQFSDLAKSQMLASGGAYYLPTSISAFGLYCNLDLLEEYGHKVPENLAEFEAVCEDFVSRGITPIVANNDISLKTVVIAKGLLSTYQQEDPSQAVRRFNDGSADLGDALRPGFELVERMLERGWVNPEEALKTAKTKDDLELFARGEQPFMLTGAWAVPRVRALNPALHFEVRPYPVFEDGSALVINIDTRVSVRADSPHVEEAKKFVEYLTQPDVMWEFVDSQCSFSPLKENKLAGDEAIQSMGQYLSNGRSVIGSDDHLTIPIWDLTRQCVMGMLEGDDAETAVSKMEELIRQWNRANEGEDVS